MALPVRWERNVDQSRGHLVFHKCDDVLRAGFKNIDGLPFKFNKAKICRDCDCIKLRQASHPRISRLRLKRDNFGLIVDLKEFKVPAILPYTKRGTTAFTARWTAMMVMEPGDTVFPAITAARGGDVIDKIIAKARNIVTKTGRRLQYIRMTDAEGTGDRLREFCDEMGADAQEGPTGEPWAVAKAEALIKTIMQDAEVALLPAVPAEFKSFAVLDKAMKHNLLTARGEAASRWEISFGERPQGQRLLPLFCAVNYIESRKRDRRRKSESQVTSGAAMYLGWDLHASTWGRVVLLWDILAGRVVSVSFESCMFYPETKLYNVLGARGTDPHPDREQLRRLQDEDGKEQDDDSREDLTETALEHKDDQRREDALRIGGGEQDGDSTEEGHVDGQHGSTTRPTASREVEQQTTAPSPSTPNPTSGTRPTPRSERAAVRDRLHCQLRHEAKSEEDNGRERRLPEKVDRDDTPVAAGGGQSEELDSAGPPVEDGGESTPATATAAGDRPRRERRQPDRFVATAEQDLHRRAFMADLNEEEAAVLQQAALDAATAEVNVLDLGSGTGAFRRAFQALGYNVLSIDKDREAEADLYVDLLEFDLTLIAIMFHVIVITLPCHTYSFGQHKHRRRSTAIPNTKAAGVADYLTARVLNAVAHFKAINPDLKIIWESPVSWMQHNPTMQLAQRHLGLRKQLVLYCQYAMDYKKPTHFFTNLEAWQPRPACCRHGAHHRGRQTYKPAKEFAANPPELTNEIARVVQAEHEGSNLHRPDRHHAMVARVVENVADTDSIRARQGAGDATADLGEPNDGFVRGPLAGDGGAVSRDERRGFIQTALPTEGPEDSNIVLTAFDYMTAHAGNVADMEEGAERLHERLDSAERRHAQPLHVASDATEGEADDGFLSFDPKYGVPGDGEEKTILTKKEAAAIPEAVEAGLAEMRGLHAMKVFDAGTDNEGFTQEHIEATGGHILFSWMIHSRKPSGRYKGRYTLRGDQLPPKVTANDKTTSATVTPTSVNLLHTIAAAKGLDIYSADVVQAYLNGQFAEELKIFTFIPHEYAAAVPYAGRYVRVRGSLYGAPHSGRIWQILATGVLKQSGFVAHVKDTCFFRREIDHKLLRDAGYQLVDKQTKTYVRREGEEVHRVRLSEITYLLLCLYVDDLRAISPHRAITLAALKPFLERFKHKERELSSPFLGTETTALPDGSIIRHYASSIKRAAAKFNTGGRRRYSPYVDPRVATTKATEEEHESAKKYKYRELAGVLLWYACGLRYDILCAVVTMCQFASCWSTEQYFALMDILCYLETTAFYGPKYDRDAPIKLEIFMDAAYNNGLNGRTIGGYVALLGGAIISAATKIFKRPLVSTFEAEVYAAHAGILASMFLRDLLEFAGFPQGPIPLKIDNQAALRFVSDQPKINARNSHIETRFWLAHYHVMQNNLQPEYIESDKNVSDGVSKILRKEKTVLFWRLGNMANAMQFA
jgi:hypothetical protein